jgi:hypothetical protein
MELTAALDEITGLRIENLTLRANLETVQFVSVRPPTHSMT